MNNTEGSISTDKNGEREKGKNKQMLSGKERQSAKEIDKQREGGERNSYVSISLASQIDRKIDR